MISHLCKISDVSRSGYYNYFSIESQKSRKLSNDRDEVVKENILKAYKFKGFNKGARQLKMTLEGHYHITYNLKRIRRIMKKYGIICPIRKANPYRRMMKATKEHRTLPNILKRNFKQGIPGKVLLTDITYLFYGQGKKAYLSTIKDGSTNEILAFNVSSNITLDIATDTILKLRNNGAGVEWPAVSPNVLSVGGTTLNVDSTGNYLSESGWSGSGGGVSSYEAVPSYQSNWSTIVGTHRGVPDVALNADPNTGIPVYDSTKYNRQSGWFEVGGTSFSAPVWAALIALADQGRTAPLTGINAITDLYNLAGTAGSTGYATNYNDITKGSNGQATLPGYDLVTGIGSLKGNSLIPNLTSALN